MDGPTPVINPQYVPTNSSQPGVVVGIGHRMGNLMTEHKTLTPRSSLEAALNELSEFERKKKEFRIKDQEERAAELRLPLDEICVR